MALIDCPECGLEVSAQATFCPRCGFPIAKEARRNPQGTAHGAWGLARLPLTALDVTKSIVGRLVMSGLFFASGIGFEAPPVIILSLVLAGSSVPLYLKARKADRLGAGGAIDPAVIEEAVERRLLEAEDRTLGQLAEVDRNAGRIADLEERLEFMERLLAKQRDGE